MENASKEIITPECPFLSKSTDFKEKYYCSAVHWGVKSDGSPVPYEIPLFLVKYCVDCEGHRGCPDFRKTAVRESHYSQSFVKMAARVLTFSLSATLGIRGSVHVERGKTASMHA